MACLASEADAAGWDGMFPLFDVPGDPDAEVRQFAEATSSVRGVWQGDGTFDVVAMGFTPKGDLARGREHIARDESAGPRGGWKLPPRSGSAWTSTLSVIQT